MPHAFELLAFWTPGPIELIVIGGIALLIFGRRLPDVARSIGRSITEFKRGMRDISNDVDTQSRLPESPDKPGAAPDKDPSHPTS